MAFIVLRELEFDGGLTLTFGAEVQADLLPAPVLLRSVKLGQIGYVPDDRKDWFIRKLHEGAPTKSLLRGCGSEYLPIRAYRMLKGNPLLLNPPKKKGGSKKPKRVKKEVVIQDLPPVDIEIIPEAVEE